MNLYTISDKQNVNTLLTHFLTSHRQQLTSDVPHLPCTAQFVPIVKPRPPSAICKTAAQPSLLRRHILDRVAARREINTTRCYVAFHGTVVASATKGVNRRTARPTATDAEGRRKPTTPFRSAAVTPSRLTSETEFDGEKWLGGANAGIRTGCT